MTIEMAESNTKRIERSPNTDVPDALAMSVYDDMQFSGKRSSVARAGGESGASLDFSSNIYSDSKSLSKDNEQKGALEKGHNSSLSSDAPSAGVRSEPKVNEIAERSTPLAAAQREARLATLGFEMNDVIQRESKDNEINEAERSTPLAVAQRNQRLANSVNARPAW